MTRTIQAITFSMLLALASMMSTQAQAVLLGEDDFESYALTNDWNPTEGVEGWSRQSDFDNTNETAAIKHGTVVSNTTQVLKLTDSDDNNENLLWHTASSGAGINTWQYDFQLSDTLAQLGGPGNFVRSNVVVRTSGNAGFYTVDARIRNGTPSVKMYTAAGATTVPDGNLLAMDTWYTMQAELDYDLELARTRFGPLGGPFSAWSAQAATAAGLVDGYLAVQVNGGVEYDNVSLNGPIPEPSTLVLLILGLATMVPRRKVSS